MKRVRELFLSEHRPKILGVNPGVATIPLFGVDVPSSSESVQLGTEFSGMEMNDKVELREEFRPLGLLVGEDFGGREILQIFVVSDDITRGGRAFKVMAPVPECLKDGKEFLIIGVIVQFWSSQGLGVECYRTDLSVGAGNRQDTVKSGSTPVGGPVKSRWKWTKEEGRWLDKGLVWLELVTIWIQRQGRCALIPCIGSSQDDRDGDGDRQEWE